MSATVATAPGEGPWNPGLKSQIPKELRALATILRPENVFTSLTGAEELASLTGFAFAELVRFRPERLALHELLIRITADFAVPDGPRIEDLGINFRQIASRLLAAHVEPQRKDLEAVYAEAERRTQASVERALGALVPGLAVEAAPAADTPRRRRLSLPRRAPPAVAARATWGPEEIAALESAAARAIDPLDRGVYRSLARVLAALFAAHGHAWGTRDLILDLTRTLVLNEFASELIGQALEPLLADAARAEGYRRLEPQAHPVVINTKGPSASGKSTLRPLQKQLAAAIGVDWSDFALISPDIWRKQLLDYASLGPAYKYAGALAADELAIVDHKLDRYMARKYRDGGMTHLLIDRFRFESFAPESGEAGSNLLTRFGESVFLFFVIAPPHLLVERAWKRGLEVGRYKAVDDTLAHAVEAYSGMPSLFFTWIRRSDKRIRFEFLDNTVPLGAPPRTVAFGDNHTMHVLDVGRMLDIERFTRIHVDATSPQALYPDAALLAPTRNLAFLERCARSFACVRFADQDSGRVYLELEAGRCARIARGALEAPGRDADARAALAAIAGSSLAEARVFDLAPVLERNAAETVTLGAWGPGAAAGLAG